MANPAATSQGSPIRRQWDKLSTLPAGKWLFSRAIGRMAPYTGTLGAYVEEIRPGYARARIKDRRGLRQHLGSVHAAALFNLAEMTSALAFMYDLPKGTQSIPTGLEIEYVKKARGILTAEAKAPVLEGPVSERQSHDVEILIRDEKQDVVCRVSARWLVGPKG